MSTHEQPALSDTWPAIPSAPTPRDPNYGLGPEPKSSDPWVSDEARLLAEIQEGINAQNTLLSQQLGVLRDIRHTLQVLADRGQEASTTPVIYCTYPGCSLHAGEDGHTHDE